MKTELAVLPPGKFAAKIDYELLLDCVHCGLCTSACPTYVETGNEAASPRGRIYLMRGVIDGTLDLDASVKGHLDTCLNCRACETACPSGVQYGRLIDPFREAMEHAEPGRTVAPLNVLQRLLMFNVFHSRRRTRLALAPARLLQWSGRATARLQTPRAARKWSSTMRGIPRSPPGVFVSTPSFGTAAALAVLARLGLKKHCHEAAYPPSVPPPPSPRHGDLCRRRSAGRLRPAGRPRRPCHA